MTAYPENKGFSRWSFAPEYGYNQFDGDIKAVGIQPVPASAQQITYGATLEYALSPIWGLALDYYFLPLNAKNNSNTIRINSVSKKTHCLKKSENILSQINSFINPVSCFFG